MLVEISQINDTKEVDLAKIVRRFLPLIESRRALKGNCPFHKDSSMSLMVLPEKNIFKCFGCGQEGGVIEFLMMMNGSSRPDAMAYLRELTVGNIGK